MMRFYAPLLISLVSLPALGESRVEFNRDIRPILTKECTACHGGVKSAGGISFVFRDLALSKGKSGKTAIVPEKPESSEMIRRLRNQDPDEVMPKPKHGPPLPEAQIALIERWIQKGAEWQEHWSFVLPKESPVTKLSNESWPSVPLDRYVLQHLDQKKIHPSPEADPAEWLRRVSLDLTGLPPAIEELDAFKKACAVDPKTAREHAVDGLLASPHLGERWAVVWLDLARYSDTFGFEKDPARTVWPYRDWLIRAFNADMPYNQFTIEQLAGDLLPNPTAEQRLATAFHRNTQNNTEGGTDDEEFRVAAVIDRVNTTWTTWQATTFGCVQCHSHPYDPIQHDEFYQFMSFFDNTEDHDLDDDYPTMHVPDDARLAEKASRLELQIRKLRDELNQTGRTLAEEKTQWQPFVPDAFKPSHGKLLIGDDGKIHTQGTLPVGAVHELSGPAPQFQALRIGIFPENDNPAKWPERGSLISKLDVNLVSASGEKHAIALKEVFADQVSGPFPIGPDCNLGDYPKLHGPRWFVVVPDQPVVPKDGDRLEIRMLQKASTSGEQATPVRRFALDVSNQGEWQKVTHQPERLKTWEEHTRLSKELQEIKGAKVPVMVEGPKRQTRVFARGNRMNKEQVVNPGIPKIFGGQTGEGMNRLDMARWLVSDNNPLTARVMVNRLWAQLFGVGIVKTQEDFGTSGTPPSDQALLDHLALRFQHDYKWSMKAMLREIVLSSTYRQAHNASKDLIERDPENRLLARGPRVRLSAEMVRDQALSAAGILSGKMFGPSVFPPQPESIWSSVYNGAKWKESQGEDRVRRGIYTYHKRTSPYPSFLTFDSPSRDLCTARRIDSNTPLQALVTMNDPAYIEAAQGLAKRMKENSSVLDGQLRRGMLLVTQQEPPADVLAVLADLYRDAASAYKQTPDAAAKLADSPEAAAMVLVANTILNLDSALTR